MELNKLKIEIIRKLMDANVSQSQKDELLKKAKEIIEQDKQKK